MQNQTLSEYLKQCRGDMSLRDVENITGISRSYISRLENGTRNPPRGEYADLHGEIL